MTNRKNKHTKKQYKEKQCSPFKKNKLPYSCLSHKSLSKIAKALTQEKDVVIDYAHLDDKELYDTVSDVFANKYNCKSEACWVNIKELMKKLPSSEVEYLQDYFRPLLPKDLVKDYTEWLSNFDIQDVLSKHERNLNDFYFYGAVPIDFNKCSVSHDLCKINIMDHKKKGENKLGIVFNTDKSNKPGEHWMAMYIDLIGNNLKDHPGIYFFDSFGSNPTKEIRELIKKIKHQGKKHNIKFIVAHNDKGYQNNTYACGFYCMHFIESMLKGISFNKYLKSNLNDKKMRRYINKCYLHPTEIKC
jgi:hypothetical protein